MPLISMVEDSGCKHIIAEDPVTYILHIRRGKDKSILEGEGDFLLEDEICEDKHPMEFSGVPIQLLNAVFLDFLLEYGRKPINRIHFLEVLSWENSCR